MLTTFVVGDDLTNLERRVQSLRIPFTHLDLLAPGKAGHLAVEPITRAMQKGFLGHEYL